MNIEILKKCVAELDGPEGPRLDYIRGMLETLIALNNPNKEASAQEIRTVLGVPDFTKPPQIFATAEAGIPARSNLNEIKRMAGEV